MFEVGSYTGSLDVLQSFVTDVWSREYDGRMSFPLWTPDYFRWQFDTPELEPPLLIAAWDEGRLVAALLGLRLPLRVGGDLRGGLLSSWLSVDPDYRGRGVVNELKAEQLRQHEQSEGEVVLSYRYVGSRFSRAARPTAAQRGDDRWSWRRIGFWARPLDPRRFARWTLSPVDRWLARAGAAFVLTPRAASGDGGMCSDGIRDYRVRDLAQCRALLRRSASQLGLSIEWTEARLQRQLDGCGVGRCLVGCQAGEIRGLISYHVLPFSSRCVEPVGIIDLIAANELSARDQRALINTALAQMRDEGAILALKLRSGDVAATTMMMTEFIARPTDSYQMIHWLTTPVGEAIPRRQQLPWR